MKPVGVFFTHFILMVPAHSFSEEARVIAHIFISKFLYVANES